ncbi:MAG: thioredoxin fold domain-containing protein [Gammaproteobacteria bacterium]|nr:thioredoxin fold domain-containing protein [Gammaproteobacteria bacterium]
MKLARLVGTCLLCLTLAPAVASERWYSDQQVRAGEPLYQRNCAVCHGVNGEATPDWKTRDANGNYPPPPLNGSAHTWHHDMDVLRRTIREGGQQLGGVMPGFEGRLNGAQIDSIIAFFQSQWPDEIYARWAKNFEVTTLPSLTDVVVANERHLTRHLRNRIGDVPFDDVSEMPLDDVWQVQLGNQFIYLLGGGRYALRGDLIDLEGGRNLTELSRRVTVIDTLAQFDDAEVVEYAPAGERRATLTVFTDTSCPFCQQLHAEVPQLQQAGIAVRYLPFPRGGESGPGYATLRSVWCADDRRQALTDAKNERYDSLPPGDCAAAAQVDAGYRAGSRLGIAGTPALFLESGEKIEGYRPATELIQLLQR